ncbi:hypothetical protein AYI68_g3528 [Smittium mucronatum]|uniref:Uncharacterized protein n=1 Tax=Smittium mucronatum TaxID=133383 RepID=A0A1R0GZP0_9FUNG|nr:hypothetical protein AYI68_g3528 [Smittium mucronatum]
MVASKHLLLAKTPTEEIIGENFTEGLGSALSERPIKEDVRSSITGSLTKLSDGPKLSLSSRASIDIDAEASLTLSSTTTRQASNSEASP